MVTEDYCGFETAKLLKEKGFNEKVICYYDDGGSLNLNKFVEFQCCNEGYGSGVFAAPTLQMAMKWLRKIHKLHIQILNPTVDEEAMEFNEEYVVGITNLSNYLFETPFDYVKFTSYEEAVEAAIKYCLEKLI